ncbi:MAG: GGDEF domain-containing protein [Burkholderiales bacterium]|nr:GGDEF domain-containing protein [Burkholderiales bacterium]
MSTNADRSGPTTSIQINSGFDWVFAEKAETSMSRFERFGLQLFDVANCFVSFGNTHGKLNQGERSITGMEAIFSDSLPLSEEIVVISDLREHPELCKHPMVAGIPFIRFFASHPVYGQGEKLVACIRLIDYQVRTLDDELRQSFSDMAALIERELALSAMHQMQTELLKQNRHLKREAMIDPLLGTWNKTAIVRSLNIEMDRCDKAGKSLALLLISLDQLPTLRDSHGLMIADQMLVKIVSRIRSCIRPFDALGRFSNDELLVVLPGASHLVATAVGERIRLAVMMHPDMVEDEKIALTISAGSVASDMFPGTEPEALISFAEKALLSARSAGNNCVVQATPAQPDLII